MKSGLVLLCVVLFAFADDLAAFRSTLGSLCYKAKANRLPLEECCQNSNDGADVTFDSKSCLFNSVQVSGSSLIGMFVFSFQHQYAF